MTNFKLLNLFFSINQENIFTNDKFEIVKKALLDSEQRSRMWMKNKKISMKGWQVYLLFKDKWEQHTKKLIAEEIVYFGGVR